MAFRDDIERQALKRRREMVLAGELLREVEFRKRLFVNEKQLARMLQRNDVFTIEVDEVAYFPALLATPGLDLKRLFSICRILAPAPPSCRFGYLSSGHANLGGVSPLEAIHDDRSYRLLQRMARAYAAEWWRTSVAIYEGSYSETPSHVAPMFTAEDEVDPRVNLWQRVAGSILSGGYTYPPGPYPHVNSASVFVGLHPAGQGKATVEARIEVRVDGDMAHACVVYPDASKYELDAIPVGDTRGVVDVVLRIAAAAKAHGFKSATI
jgi:hypothetical protein